MHCKVLPIFIATRAPLDFLQPLRRLIFSPPEKYEQLYEGNALLERICKKKKKFVMKGGGEVHILNPLPY